MENFNTKNARNTFEFCDGFFTNLRLNDEIKSTNNLKLLYMLLNLKNKRIINKQCTKIIFPANRIYEQDTHDLPLQCEVLKLALSVTENEDEEIDNVIKYLNSLINHSNSPNLPITTSLKIAHILREICSIKYKDHLKNRSFVHINKFLLLNLAQKNSPTRIYILSNILNNYLNLLNGECQVNFIDELFVICKHNKNLDVLCILCNDVYIQSALMKDKKSIFSRDDFWEYLEESLSCLDDNNLMKQALFLLKKIVEFYYENIILNDNMAFIKISNMSVEGSKKIWQCFFVLLETCKEKQLHLVWPSLPFLNSVKYLNYLWQKSIYKLLLNHPHDFIVSYVIDYVLQENIILPELFHVILSATNKNDFFNSSISMFTKIPLFCNKLKDKDFVVFLNYVLKITWAPTAMWYFFTSLFSSKLEKKIPLNYFKLIYDLILKSPHIYIRNGCAEIFVTYFLDHYEWKDDYDCIFKMLVVLRDYNEKLFVNTILSHVDTQFINNLKQSEWIMEKNNLRPFEIFVQIIKILDVQEILNLLIRDKKDLDDELLIIVYANNLDYFCRTDMENIVQKINSVSNYAVSNLLLIFNNLMKHYDFNQKMYLKLIDVLLEPNRYSLNEIHIALYIIIHFFSTCDAVKNIINRWMKNDFSRSDKFSSDILILFCELYFMTVENCDISFLEHICNSESDLVISQVIEKFVTIAAPKSSVGKIKFLKLGLNILLPGLTKSKHFNICVQNYINCLFLINWSKFTKDIENMNLITRSINVLLQYAETYPSINYYLSINIRKLTHQFDYDNHCYNILIAVIVELLLRGMIIKKEERVEYNVCQDIYQKLENGENNPNMRKVITRLSSLESMLNLISKRTEYADDFASCLIEKYKIYFNKRYFPDSQIHLLKLRIIQILLIIHPFIKHQRQSLIDLIMDSFCIEIHQPCVKQLMQWLLFCLLKNEENSVPLLAEKIESTTKTQPSTVAAFILVLLYITFSKSEPFWCSAVEALLPWCMGPHFKLRVYSQMAIKILCKEAKKRSYQDFERKYGFLDNSVNFIIEASGQSFQDSLKSDELFFNAFSPERDYSLQTILIDIPKLNNVAASEWQNIFYYKFTDHYHISLINQDKTFSNGVTTSRNINKDKEDIISCENIGGINFNIQRKITPWKISMEELANDKQLGDFIVIASLINKPTNLGGLSRTCEVFGVKQLVLNDGKLTNDKNFKGLSMTSENWVDCVEVKVSDLQTFILELRDKGYCIVGAEQTSESICLNKYQFEKRTALILGNEKEGIPPDLIPILDACVEIPQLGLVRSLNVHVAGSTFIWEYAKQHLIR